MKISEAAKKAAYDCCRAAFQPAFSEGNIKRYEPIIQSLLDSETRELREALKALVDSYDDEMGMCPAGLKEKISTAKAALSKAGAE